MGYTVLDTDGTLAANSASRISAQSAIVTYVSNAISGVNPATAVQWATTTAGNTSGLTYSNGASGVGATMTGVNNTTTTFDGHTFVIGDVGVTRVLIKNDTQSPSGAFNGVYLFTALHTAGTGDIFTRATDYDTSSDINNTGAIPVVNGTANASTSWLLTSSVTTVGTDPLTYTQFSVNPTTVLIKSNNLSDVSSASTSRANLGSTTVGDAVFIASNSAAARTAIGAVIGTNVEAWSANLDTLSGLTATTGNFIVSQSSAWTSRSVANVKTDLGVPLTPMAIYLGTTADYWLLAGTTVSTNAVTSGRAYYTPFYVPKSTGVDRAGVTVTAAGNSGATIELGLYNDSSGRPGSLVDSYGTVAGDGIASVEKTISKTLATGWYWYAVLPVFGGTMTLRTVTGLENAAPSTSIANATTQNNTGWIQSSLATLPNPAVASGVNTFSPAMAYRLT